jgi:hypothetical protein
MLLKRDEPTSTALSTGCLKESFFLAGFNTIVSFCPTTVKVTNNIRKTMKDLF